MQINITPLFFQADRVIRNSRPVSSWPQQGVVQFHDFQMRYRDGLPLVLKDLNFVINPAEKVGMSVMRQSPSIRSLCTIHPTLLCTLLPHSEDLDAPIHCFSKLSHWTRSAEQKQ